MGAWPGGGDSSASVPAENPGRARLLFPITPSPYFGRIWDQVSAPDARPLTTMATPESDPFNKDWLERLGTSVQLLGGKEGLLPPWVSWSPIT